MRSASASVKRDLRQEVTDSVIAALEKGVAPWQRPWQSGAFEMPMNPTSGKPYRGGNAVHLMVVGMRNGYEDPRWLTYHQAQTPVTDCTSREVRSRSFPDHTSLPPARRTGVRAGHASSELGRGAGLLP